MARTPGTLLTITQETRNYRILQKSGKRATLRTLRDLNRDRQEKSKVANAINNVKPSRAIGPDRLPMLMLKKLGKELLDSLLHYLNCLCTP